MPGSGLPEGEYLAAEWSFDNLFYKVNNTCVLLPRNFNAVSNHGLIYAAIVDGYIRPLYNERGEHIVVSERNHRKIPIGRHESEKMGFHKHYSEVFPNLPAQVEKH